MTNLLHIGIFQMDSIWLQPNENIQKVKRLLTRIEDLPDVLILPEMFNTGFTMNPKQHAESMEGYTLEAMLKLSAKYQIAFMFSIPISTDEGYFNRCFLLEDGLINNTYDKAFLFSPSTEDVHYQAGECREIFNFKGVRILPQVCYDLRFPEMCVDIESVDVLINIANWPTKRIAHYTKLLTGRAIENQCYAIGANRTGRDGNDWIFNGQSLVVDYQGETLLEADEEESYHSIVLDIAAVRAYKEKLPFFRDKRRIG